jgi:hypothetical protein
MFLYNMLIELLEGMYLYKISYLHALLYLNYHCAIPPYKLEVGIYPTTPTWIAKD